MSDLDLEDGDEARAEASPSERRRLARQAAADGKERSRTARTTKAKTPAAAAKEDVEVGSRLHRTFDRLAKWREKVGDDELAEIIREDSDAMEQGIVSLTKNAPFLRGPLLFFLNVIEPVMAFQRIARTLFGRWQARAERKDWERQEQERQGAPDGLQVVQ